jgi:hypothetical protein
MPTMSYVLQLAAGVAIGSALCEGAKAAVRFARRRGLIARDRLDLSLAALEREGPYPLDDLRDAYRQVDGIFCDPERSLALVTAGVRTRALATVVEIALRQAPTHRR